MLMVCSCAPALFLVDAPGPPARHPPQHVHTGVPVEFPSLTAEGRLRARHNGPCVASVGQCYPGLMPDVTRV